VSKAYRQEQILKIVRSRAVHSQAALAAALRQAGLETTQVTLSRDLKDLGLVKTPAGYAIMDAEPASTVPELNRVLEEFVRDVRRAQNLLVLKTEPGAAQTVAVALDHEGWSELVGSIGGDDTVLLICETERLAGAVERRLRDLIGT